VVGEMKVGEILVGEMQVGEKTWSVKLKVGEILGHQILLYFLLKLKYINAVNKFCHPYIEKYKLIKIMIFL
jgi:hypothetical protein